MSVNPRRELAVAIGRGGRPVSIRQGVLKSKEASSVTVTIDGVDVAGIRYWTQVNVTGMNAGDSVDLLVTGSDIRLLGKLA